MPLFSKPRPSVKITALSGHNKHPVGWYQIAITDYPKLGLTSLSKQQFCAISEIKDKMWQLFKRFELESSGLRVLCCSTCAVAT